MPAAPDRKQEALIPGKTDSSDDVRDIRRSNNEQWPFVDHSVIQLTGFFIGGIFTSDDSTSESPSRHFNGCIQVAHFSLHFAGYAGTCKVTG
jgi:hypothetical protein